MKKTSILLIISLITVKVMAQNTNVLPNRLDFAQRTYSQILAIPTPQKGSTCYDTDNNCLRIYDGSTWRCTTSAASAGFNDATGVCSGATCVTTSGSPVGSFVVFKESTSYNNEIYEVGYGQYGNLMYGFNFGAGSFYTGTGGNVGFVAKHDANGTNLWATGIAPNPSNGSYFTVNSTVNSIKVNATGVYIIGTFSGALAVGTPNTTTLTSAGGSDIFVIKMDAATGAFIWAKQFGGAGNDSGIDLTFGENSSYLYFTGYDNGMSVGYCVPSTGSQKIFIGKLDTSTGASIGNGAAIVEPIAHSERINSILFYDNKVLLVGSFVGSIYAAYVAAGCSAILSGTTLVGTTGREVFILSYDTGLMPTSYKMAYAGNDAADDLGPLKATLENGFSGGYYASKLKICGNPVGTFPLGNRTVNAGGYIMTLNLNFSVLPTINEVITLQGGTFTGFGDGYAVGICPSASGIINGSINIGCSAGQNFMLSTNNAGLFNWVINSIMIIGSSGGLGTQSTTVVSKLCNKVYAFGTYTNGIRLCNSTLDATNKKYGFWWQYNECGGSCN
ncbi:hypothetical protein [Emticicia sp. SJ17W-69]|uniref:hypothetical protein n=1 Tax=Emticicia sp. SJ17W-69 TaxID=3421657 RepID=UPI003EB72B17